MPWSARRVRCRPPTTPNSLPCRVISPTWPLRNTSCRPPSIGSAGSTASSTMRGCSSGSRSASTPSRTTHRCTARQPRRLFPPSGPSGSYLPHLVAQGGGHVVNISTSLAEYADSSRPCALAALTKGGLTAVTRSLAIEYAARGVRVNAVSLGVIQTPENDPASYDGLGDLHPLGRVEPDQRRRGWNPLPGARHVRHRRDVARSTAARRRGTEPGQRDLQPSATARALRQSTPGVSRSRCSRIISR